MEHFLTIGACISLFGVCYFGIKIIGLENIDDVFKAYLRGCICAFALACFFILLANANKPSALDVYRNKTILHVIDNDNKKDSIVFYKHK